MCIRKNKIWHLIIYKGWYAMKKKKKKKKKKKNIILV